MSWVLGVVAVTLGIIFLWGLFAPRSQWHVLSGWSVSNPHLSEPGGSTYAVLRLLSGLGALGLLVVGMVAATPFLANLPQATRPVTALEEMWGTPSPQVVDRVFTPLGAPPAGLVEMPLLGYQEFDEKTGAAEYLSRLETFTLLGSLNVPGYIGTMPEVDFSALDTAAMVVHVRGPLLCVPRQAVVIESETTVQIGIFYGLPDDPEGATVDNAADCPVDAGVTGSLLIPVPLAAPLGNREVQALGGAPVTYVAAVE